MDTFAGKICVVRCIHNQNGKAWIQMSKKTHMNPLSRLEVEKLLKNPYIASVTVNTVHFTEAFKELAYEKKIQGVPVAETMRKCGIAPEIRQYVLKEKGLMVSNLYITQAKANFCRINLKRIL